jgi:hypothetical protein
MSLPARKSNEYPAIVHLEISDDRLTAQMSDGREVSIPIAWFNTLATATQEELRHFEISPAGYGIHWPDLDEDISVKAFLT